MQAGMCVAPNGDTLARPRLASTLGYMYGCYLSFHLVSWYDTNEAQATGNYGAETPVGHEYEMCFGDHATSGRVFEIASKLNLTAPAGPVFRPKSISGFCQGSPPRQNQITVIDREAEWDILSNNIRES